GVGVVASRVVVFAAFAERVAVAAGDRLAVGAGDRAAGLDEGGGVGAGFVEGVPVGRALTLPSPRWGRGYVLIERVIGGAGFGECVVTGDGVAGFEDRGRLDRGFGEADGLKRGRLSYGIGFHERGNVGFDHRPAEVAGDGVAGFGTREEE